MKMYWVWSSTAFNSVFSHIFPFLYLLRSLYCIRAGLHHLCYIALTSDNCVFRLKSRQIVKLNHGIAVLHTSESLVAWCDGEGALLHCQLVELGELWRDSSRGRLWQWERGGRKRNGGNGKHRKKEKENTHTHTSQSIQTAIQTNFQNNNKKSHITQYCCEQIYS